MSLAINGNGGGFSKMKTYVFSNTMEKVKDDAILIKGDIKNPAGNLALHLCGNLQHYIGAVLGNTGYVRERPMEFSLKNISAKDLALEIIKIKEAIKRTFTKLDPALLDEEYPEKVFDYPMTTQYFLIHLTAHLGYHLGQVNYHRRLIKG